MTNALRPSELFAFRWKRFDYQASTLTVAETVYKGNIHDWGKTKKSLAVIHIRKTSPTIWKRGLLSAKNGLNKLRRRTDAIRLPVPSDFIFTNEVGGFLDTDNFRKRVLHKLARDLNLPKLTFQVIRRTIATLAQKKERERMFRVSCGTHVPPPPRTSTCRRYRRACNPRSIRSTVNARIERSWSKKIGISRHSGWGRRKAAKRELTPFDTK